MSADADGTCELATTGGQDPSRCITCSDEAHPMRVLAVDEQRCLALCEAADGAHQSVEILLVAPVAVGDALLVHAGTALGRVAVTA